MTSGATLRRVTLPAGFAVSGLATDPRRRHLYAGAESGSGRGGVFEYLAGTGAPVASGTSPPVEFAVSGPWLTAVPGAVWASFRTGMKGATVLLRQRDLATVPLHRPIFGWDMFATTVYGGGALWLATMDGVIGCIGPRSGAVRARAALRALRASGRLLRVDPDRHLVYGVGQRGVVAITPPLSCWA
jgi:hypothetical protein